MQSLVTKGDEIKVEVFIYLKRKIRYSPKPDSTPYFQINKQGRIKWIDKKMVKQ